MAFGGKVDHCTRLVSLQQLGNQVGIANVTLHKHMVRVVLQAGQGFQIARISQLVQVDHGFRRFGQPV